MDPTAVRVESPTMVSRIHPHIAVKGSNLTGPCLTRFGKVFLMGEGQA